jgi:hypothetical protein
MKLTNLQKQILLFIGMIVFLLLFSYVDMDLYKMVFMAIGGWQIGKWFHQFAESKWPRNKEQS